MSGTGKSTLLGELARRGHRVVDTDEPGWSEEVPLAGGGVEQLWVEPRMAALLAEEAPVPLFVAGCVRNQGGFRGCFDEVVLLTAPVDVLMHRIATRTTNPFGKDPAEAGPDPARPRRGRAPAAGDVDPRRAHGPAARRGRGRRGGARRPRRRVAVVVTPSWRGHDGVSDREPAGA